MPPFPPALRIALKEWAVVCDALAAGRQFILLRKGGIYETAGEFEVEHRHFLLFPTYLHQSPAMLKPSGHARLTTATAEPDHVSITLAAQVTDILRLTSRGQMDAIDAEHVWTPALIDMRFNYRPENPLYLLLLRAWRLPAPTSLPNTPAYAGCKSWVPLDETIDTGGATAAIGDEEYERRRIDLLERIVHR